MSFEKEDVIKEIHLLEKKLKRIPYKRDNARLYYLSRKHFGSWNNLLEKAGYEVKRFQTPDIPSLNKNSLYYFMGLLCTDGHIQFLQKGGKYKLIIFTSYDEEKKMIIDLIKELFNYNASIRMKKYGFSKKFNHEVYISSKKVCEFFIQLGVPSGAKSLIIKIPKVVKESKDDFFWNFVRGLFDGDGSIVKNTFKIVSGSEKFIQELKNLFLKRDFSPKVRKERERLWVLKIHKKKEIEKIYSLIYLKNNNYFYPRKKLKWEKQYI